MIIWSCDHIIIWSSMIIYIYIYMISRSYDQTITWSSDHKIIRSFDHMIIWSYDRMMVWLPWLGSHVEQASNLKKWAVLEFVITEGPRASCGNNHWRSCGINGCAVAIFPPRLRHGSAFVLSMVHVVTILDWLPIVLHKASRMAPKKRGSRNGVFVNYTIPKNWRWTS